MRKLVVVSPGPEGRFEKQWKWNPKNRTLENLVLGVSYQVVDVVFEDNKEIHHEGVILLSRRAEIHVAIRSDSYIGLVYHRREKVIPPEVSQKIFEKDSSQIPGIEHVLGIEEYECPHGLALEKLVEAEEETGYKIVETEHVGFIKDSPPGGGIAHVLFATLLSSKRSDKTLEAGEQIMGFKFFLPEEVKNIPTICGLTQAALWRFRSWGLKQPESSVWHVTANRM